MLIHVMLTANLWPEVGLCNGAAGVVYQLLYAENQEPPSLPIAVLVDFDSYTGPPFLSVRPKSIPIPPITSEWDAQAFTPADTSKITLCYHNTQMPRTNSSKSSN